MKKIILLLGESGSGKTTIANMLEEEFKLKSIQSYTTRKPRYDGETGHIFLSFEEFGNIKIKDIVAYTEFNGNKYCATKQQVKENDIYVIDTNGINYFKKNYKGEKIPLIIYIKSSLETRRERMELRGDSEEKINERLKNDARCFIGAENMADVVIENNSNTNLYDIVSQIWFEFIE